MGGATSKSTAEAFRKSYTNVTSQALTKGGSSTTASNAYRLRCDGDLVFRDGSLTQVNKVFTNMTMTASQLNTSDLVQDFMNNLQNNASATTLAPFVAAGTETSTKIQEFASTVFDTQSIQECVAAVVAKNEFDAEADNCTIDNYDFAQANDITNIQRCILDNKNVATAAQQFVTDIAQAAESDASLLGVDAREITEDLAGVANNLIDEAGGVIDTGIETVGEVAQVGVGAIIGIVVGVVVVVLIIIVVIAVLASKGKLKGKAKVPGVGEVGVGGAK